MPLIIFIGGLLFLAYPALSGKSRESFVDYYLLFCLYFDLVDVFVPDKEINFIFSQYIIMLIFSSYYFYINYSTMKRMVGAIFFLTLFFLFISLLVPLLHGSSMKTNLIETSQILSSFAILPIAFHHYATKGTLVNLYKKAMIFSYTLVGAILVFTLLKIDSNYINDSGLTWMSAEELGNILYFGNFGVRGGFTYIGFLVLLFPLFFIYKIRSRNLIFLILAFLLLFMALSFKRFTFAIVLIGTVIYFSSTNIGINLRLRIIFSLVSLILVMILLFNIHIIITERFKARGGSRDIGKEAIENDIRLFEVDYAYKEIRKTYFNLIFGKQSDRMLFINTKRHLIGEWNIHNQYAQYLLKYGLLGTATYFLLLLILYKSVKKNYHYLKINSQITTSIKFNWLLFKTYLLAFIAAGMIGGLDKVTIRGIVFIFLGAIGGSFYKLAKQHKIQKETL